MHPCGQIMKYRSRNINGTVTKFLNFLKDLGKESEVKWSGVAQSCPTLCDPVDCSLPGSSLHGILQARVLEWGASSFSRGSSQPRNRTLVSRIPGRHFHLWATREALSNIGVFIKGVKMQKIFKMLNIYDFSAYWTVNWLVARTRSYLCWHSCLTHTPSHSPSQFSSASLLLN